MILSGLKNKFASQSRAVEGFENEDNQRCQYFFVFRIMFLVLLSVVGFVLWNEILAGADNGKGFITILKPLPTVLYAFFMFVSLDLFLNPVV